MRSPGFVFKAVGRAACKRKRCQGCVGITRPESLEAGVQAEAVKDLPTGMGHMGFGTERAI